MSSTHEQPTHHPPRVQHFSITAQYSRKTDPPTTQERTMYNSSTASQQQCHPPSKTHPPTTCVQQYSSTVVKQKKSKQENRSGFELTLMTSRIQRSTAETKYNVVVLCRLREANFEKSSFDEFGWNADSLAGDREGCCMGGTWRGRAVSGVPVATRSNRCWKSQTSSSSSSSLRRSSIMK